MSQHRNALANLLRPQLKPPGFNDPALLKAFDALLDGIGVAPDALTPPPLARFS